MDPIHPTRLPFRAAVLAVAAVACLGVLASAPAGADVVYKWVDAQGRVHYSDRPPSGDGKLLAVEQTNSSHHSSGSEHAPAPARTPAPAATPAATASPGVNAAERRAVAEDVAAAAADNCKKAQERYQNYIHWRHIYREGPNQERVYLSDQEIETERLNAKREADEACGAGS